MNDSYKVLPIEREDITLLARLIRKITNTLDKPYFPILYFMEFMLLNYDDIGFDIVEDSEFKEEIQGRTYPNLNTIQLKESVYEGLLKDNPQDRFTLAHELGHYFMHDNYIRTNQNIKTKENPEWQADTFSKELLAPSCLFKDFNPNYIAKICKIPIEYAKEQSDYVIANEIMEFTFNKKTYIKNIGSVVTYQNTNTESKQSLFIPSRLSIFRKFKLK